jgi:hypothetical protein
MPGLPLRAGVDSNDRRYAKTRQNFNCNVALQLCVARAINLAHPALPEESRDFMAPRCVPMVKDMISQGIIERRLPQLWTDFLRKGPHFLYAIQTIN